MTGCIPHERSHRGLPFLCADRGQKTFCGTEVFLYLFGVRQLLLLLFQLFHFVFFQSGGDELV